MPGAETRPATAPVKAAFVSIPTFVSFTARASKKMSDWKAPCQTQRCSSDRRKYMMKVEIKIDTLSRFTALSRTISLPLTKFALIVADPFTLSGMQTKKG